MKIFAYICFLLALVTGLNMLRAVSADLRAGEDSDVIMGAVLWMLAVPLVFTMLGVWCYRSKARNAKRAMQNA